MFYLKTSHGNLDKLNRTLCKVLFLIFLRLEFECGAW